MCPNYKNGTFKWYVSSLNELLKLKGTEETASTRSPEHQMRNAQPLRVHREGHQEVRYDASDRGSIHGTAEFLQELSDGGSASFSHRRLQLFDVKGVGGR